SYAVATKDGKGFPRNHIDGQQLGYSAGHRLYEAKQGWLCFVLVTQEHWDEFFSVLGTPELVADPRFATHEARKQNDDALAKLIAERLKAQTAAEWFGKFDKAGVPVEVASEDFSRKLHDDPEFRQRKWVVSYPHPHVGKLDQIGLLFDLSDTPGVIQGRPLIV